METSDFDILLDGKLLMMELNGRVFLSGVCRLCGRSDENLLPIFEEIGLEKDFSSKIRSYLPIQIIEGDSLPRKVCSQCASTLVTWHDFSVNCVKVDKKLLEILKYIENNEIDQHAENLACGIEHEVNFKLPSNCEESRSYLQNETVTEMAFAPADDVIERFQAQESQVLISSIQNQKDLVNSTVSVFDKEANIQLNQNLQESVIFSHSNAPYDSVGKGLGVKYYSLIIDEQNSNKIFSPKSLSDNTSSYEDYCGNVTLVTGFSDANSGTMCVFKESIADNNSQFTLEHNYVLQDTDNPNIEDGSISQDSSTLQSTDNCENIFYYTVKPYVVKVVKMYGDSVMCKIAWKHSENNDVVQCDFCKKSFKNMSILQTHLRFHSGLKPFYCKFCGKNFCLSASLREHLKTCCDNCCELDQVKETTVVRNSVVKENEQKFICEFCGKIYKLKASLRQHAKLHEGKARMKLKCEICGARFLKKAEAMEHVKLHDTKSLSTCNVCEKSFLNQKDLQEHKISHSNIRPFNCTICGMTYKRKSHLTRHVLSHTTNQDKNVPTRSKPHFRRMPGEEYRCELCKKVCRTRHLLALHMISHTGERNHVCYLCGKRFGQSGALSRHLHIVHGGAKDFRCEVCNRCFTSKATKDNHMRIHTGEKPYQCTQCGKTFRTKQQHKLHEKIHSDVRPYACHYCEKRFRRRPHLTVHIRTHTGEKPYACVICGRNFTQKYELNKHMKIHRKDYLKEPVSVIVDH